MTQPELRTVEGCPITHLISGAEFAKPSMYLSGWLGVELLSPSAQRLEEGEILKINLVFNLDVEPWTAAKAFNLKNGLWMIHPEDSKAGIGMFHSIDDAGDSLPHLKVHEYRTRMVILGETFRGFLDPLWKSINEMKKAFWETKIVHADYEDTFDAGLEILQNIKKARKIYCICRLSSDHPYWRNTNEV